MAYEAVEKLTRSAQDSYETLIDHTVAIGERNVKFVRGAFDATVREHRQQTEANLALTQELFEQAEKQRDAFWALTAESFDAYWGVLYAPLDRYKEVLRRARPAGEANGRPPIPDYDELTVEEVIDKLEDLSTEEIEKVRAYEKRHKDRETLLARIDRKLKAAS